MAKKNFKRRKNHPFLPPPRKRRPKDVPSGLSAAARAAFARTAAGKKKLAELAKGADMRALDKLAAVVYPTGIKPTLPGLHKKLRDQFDDDDAELVEVEMPAKPPMAPPAVIRDEDMGRFAYRCSGCFKPGHTIKKCPDLKTAPAGLGAASDARSP